MKLCADLHAVKEVNEEKDAQWAQTREDYEQLRAPQRLVGPSQHEQAFDQPSLNTRDGVYILYTCNLVCKLTSAVHVLYSFADVDETRPNEYVWVQ